MQGSLNKMAPANRQWRQAADWARELAHLVDTMQTWLARQLSSTRLPFQKVCSGPFERLHCPSRRSVLALLKGFTALKKDCSGSAKRPHCSFRRTVLVLSKDFDASACCVSCRRGQAPYTLVNSGVKLVVELQIGPMCYRCSSWLCLMLWWISL